MSDALLLLKRLVRPQEAILFVIASVTDLLHLHVGFLLMCTRRASVSAEAVPASESAAVVLHGEAEGAVGAGDAAAHVARLRVLGAVGERFLEREEHVAPQLHLERGLGDVAVGLETHRNVSEGVGHDLSHVRD